MKKNMTAQGFIVPFAEFPLDTNACEQKTYIPPETQIGAAPPYRLDLATHVFFFDIDGTLSDLALTPQDAVIPASALQDLAILNGLTGLALVSGRALASIDAMTAPMRLAAAGQHGLELRLNANEARATPRPKAIIEVEKAVRAFHAQYPDLIIEYKGLSVAIHYRLAPKLGDAVQRFLSGLAAGRDGNLTLQSGKMVFEIKLAGAHKGTAINAFMAQSRFRGKVPVFAGDDVTDEDAYSAITALNGIAIHVGAISAKAQFYLPHPQALRDWLHTLCMSGSNNG